MSSTQGPKSSASLGYTGDELEGQYRIPDGQQCMQFTQIASDGGLLPFPVTAGLVRAVAGQAAGIHRRLHQVPGRHPDHQGRRHLPDQRDEDARRPDVDQLVPLLPGPGLQGAGAEDRDRRRRAGQQRHARTEQMRDLPPLPSNWQTLLDNRLIFEVERGAAGGEIEWLINGKPFDPADGRHQPEEQGRQDPAGPAEEEQLQPLGDPQRRRRLGAPVPPAHGGAPHRHAQRQGRDQAARTPAHPDDVSREDLVALDPGESVIVYRGFRDFVGPYVAHCHNLAHEDHAMMFGWEITP